MAAFFLHLLSARFKRGFPLGKNGYMAGERPVGQDSKKHFVMPADQASLVPVSREGTFFSY
jgi:hypothetical protein